jgi:altronate dehydratase small subunit
MKAIVVSERDNVATALTDIEALESVDVRIGETVCTILVLEPIPFGFKFAICNISAVHDIVKYGKSIGKSKMTIDTGKLVHNHNVE